jgi:hypothetical protein
MTLKGSTPSVFKYFAALVLSATNVSAIDVAVFRIKFEPLPRSRPLKPVLSAHMTARRLANVLQTRGSKTRGPQLLTRIVSGVNRVNLALTPADICSRKSLPLDPTGIDQHVSCENVGLVPQRS